MNKKIITIITLLIIIIISVPISLFILKNNNNNIKKFYLDDSFYNKGEYIDINNNDLTKYNNKNYILFVYNNFCAFSKPCEEVFQEYMKKYNIDFLSMKFEYFKKTKLYKKIKYAPSVIIIKNNG